jgi:transketolase
MADEKMMQLAISGVAHGAYVLGDAPGGNPEVILIASGSDVQSGRRGSREAHLGEHSIRIEILKNTLQLY